MKSNSSDIQTELRSIVFSNSEHMIDDSLLIQSELYDYLTTETPHTDLFVETNGQEEVNTDRLFKYIHRNPNFLNYMSQVLGIQMGLFAQRHNEETNYLFGLSKPDIKNPELDAAFYLPAFYRNNYNNKIELEPAFQYNLILNSFHSFRSHKKWLEHSFVKLSSNYYAIDKSLKNNSLYNNQIIYSPSGEIDLFCLTYLFSKLETNILKSIYDSLDNVVNNRLNIKFLKSIKFSLLENNGNLQCPYDNEEFDLLKWINYLGFIQYNEKSNDETKITNRGLSFIEYIKHLLFNKSAKEFFDNSYNSYSTSDKDLIFKESDFTYMEDNIQVLLMIFYRLIGKIATTSLLSNIDKNSIFPIVPHSILRYGRRGFGKIDISSRAWLVFPLEKELIGDNEINTIFFLCTFEDLFSDGEPMIKMFDSKYTSKYEEEFKDRINQIKNLTSILADYQFKGLGKLASARRINLKFENEIKNEKIPTLFSLMLNTCAVKNVTHGNSPTLFINNNEIQEEGTRFDLAKFQITELSNTIIARLNNIDARLFEEVIKKLSELNRCNSVEEIANIRDNYFRKYENNSISFNDLFFCFYDFFKIEEHFRGKGIDFKFRLCVKSKPFKWTNKYNPLWKMKINRVNVNIENCYLIYACKINVSKIKALKTNLVNVSNKMETITASTITNLIGKNIVEFCEFWLGIKIDGKISIYNLIAEATVEVILNDLTAEEILDKLEIKIQGSREDFIKHISDNEFNEFIILKSQTASS